MKDGDKQQSLLLSSEEEKDRAIRRKLLRDSPLIDAADAIQPRSKKVFSGWEPVRELIVTRDESLLAVKRSGSWKKEDEGSDNEDEQQQQQQQQQTLIADRSESVMEKKEEKKETIPKKTIKRPASVSRISQASPSPSSSSSSFLPPPTQISPTALYSSNLMHLEHKSDEYERKDFLPKLDPKHVPYKKDRDNQPMPKASIGFDPPPVINKLQMYKIPEKPSSSFNDPFHSPSSHHPPLLYKPYDPPLASPTTPKQMYNKLQQIQQQQQQSQQSPLQTTGSFKNLEPAGKLPFDHPYTSNKQLVLKPPPPPPHPPLPSDDGKTIILHPSASSARLQMYYPRSRRLAHSARPLSNNKSVL